MAPVPSPIKSLNVAVIGAGAAGIVAARELCREGHSVVVFERQNQIGGTWIFTEHTESDPLSLDPSRTVIQTSIYKSLRTNLPRECMGFRDYPFVARSDESRDPRRFPGHEEVLTYLQEFAREFGIEEMVRFEMKVLHVELDESGKWRIKSQRGIALCDEIYDAVVVCSGHYTEPRLSDIPGIDVWPGKQIHSHNYRDPEPFRDQVIVLIGNASSATDISRDIAGVAKEVHVASRSAPSEAFEKQPGHNNIWLHSMVESVHEDGTVVFRNGRVVLASVIMYCTGYKYHFPYLETNGIVTVDDNRVGPLYKHVFPPLLAPSLSFVGIPFKVCPFPMFEFQSKWIAGVLSGRVKLPPQNEMMEDVKAFYKTLEDCDVPKRYTHQLGDTQDFFCSQSTIIGWLHDVVAQSLRNGERKCLMHASSYINLHRVCLHIETNGKMVTLLRKHTRTLPNTADHNYQLSMAQKTLQKLVLAYTLISNHWQTSVYMCWLNYFSWFWFNQGQ